MTQFRDALGRRRRQPNLSEKEIHLILDLRDAKKSWREIGQLMGRDWSGLAKRYALYGGKMRQSYRYEKRVQRDPTIVNYKPLQEWPAHARF